MARYSKRRGRRSYGKRRNFSKRRASKRSRTKRISRYTTSRGGIRL